VVWLGLDHTTPWVCPGLAFDGWTFPTEEGPNRANTASIYTPQKKERDQSELLLATLTV
jgi:hypothetical protein